MGAVLDFYQEYQSGELERYHLPDAITTRYDLKACLKMTEDKQVYLVTSKTNWKKYILKAVACQCPENLEEEYKLHQSLSHPGMIGVQEYIKGSNYNYLIRDYIEGFTITEMVEMTEEGHLKEDEILNIMFQLCDILQYLHSQTPPIIHRDIKPDNIIITKQKECKLIDFGISRRYHNTMERDTVIMGTQFSAPPEQYGFAQTNHRSDIYSIGILMYYMATGNLNIHDLKQYHLPKRIKRIITKCTRFSPEKRYASVKHLRKQLEYASNNKKPAYFRIAGVAALLIVVGGAILLGQNPRDIDTSDRKLEEVPVSEHNTEDITNTSKAAAVDQGTTVTATPSVAFQEDDPYEFQSSLIEKAVRDQLGLSSKDPVTYGDLKQITSLFLCGEQSYRNWDEHFVYGVNQYMSGSDYNETGLFKNNGGITTLEDISYMINLEQLALYNQKISDLTPLAKLPYLAKLGVGSNNISNLEPVLSMECLGYLDISANPVMNDEITKLSALKNLWGLDLGATKVTSIYGIKNMPLSYLSLFECKMGDCVGLEEMTGLDNLIITGVKNAITENAIDRISKLTKLQILKIFGSGEFDLSKLSTLKSLYLLDLCGMWADTDLSRLNNPSVEQLYIDVWQHLNLTGAENFPNVTVLSLRNSVCNDYTPLLKMKNLQTVYCTQKQAKSIREQLGNLSFEIVEQVSYEE